MTKQEYAKKHGLKVRRATPKENANADCKVGTTAKYVIETSNGRKFWSQNGTMDDLRCANAATRSEAARTLRRRPIKGASTAKSASGSRTGAAKKTTTARNKTTTAKKARR